MATMEGSGNAVYTSSSGNDVQTSTGGCQTGTYISLCGFGEFFTSFSEPLPISVTLL